MTCITEKPTFRLLDGLIGWDEASIKDLRGEREFEGIRLKPLHSMEGIIEEKILWSRIPPPQLAQGCGPCEWFLASSKPYSPKVLTMDACSQGWHSFWAKEYTPEDLINPITIAARRNSVAVADEEAQTIWVWSRKGEKLDAKISIAKPGAITFAPWGDLIVFEHGLHKLLRFDPTGIPRGNTLPELPKGRKVDRIAIDRECRIWVVTKEENKFYRLWVAKCDDQFFHPASQENFEKAFIQNGIQLISEKGFCLQGFDPSGLSSTLCYSWNGCLIDSSEIPVPDSQKFKKKGQLLTFPIDSGKQRCEWHRVRIDAEIPKGTNVFVAVSTNEDPFPISQGIESDNDWDQFDPGIPHSEDWQPSGNKDILDFLINQPPGRYLFLRLRLTGDGTNTPTVRKIRLDFPRYTSLDYLPAVYRENPKAEDFTERFLSLFDASIEDLDRTIERFPALLDPDSVPEEILPWLGGFLDLVMDPEWDLARRKRILKDLPMLFPIRGTVEGLRQSIKIIFDLEPVIEESASQAIFGAIGHSRLSGVRLFGRARSRFLLGKSKISNTPIKSFGNPDHDALNLNANRFNVLMPPIYLGKPTKHRKILDLVNRLKPAHTVGTVRIGGQGMVVGILSTVGVDTALTPPNPSIIGKQSLRLNHTGILWASRQGQYASFKVGQTTIIGN